MDGTRDGDGKRQRDSPGLKPQTGWPAHRPSPRENSYSGKLSATRQGSWPPISAATLPPRTLCMATILHLCCPVPHSTRGGRRWHRQGHKKKWPRCWFWPAMAAGSHQMATCSFPTASSCCFMAHTANHWTTTWRSPSTSAARTPPPLPKRSAAAPSCPTIGWQPWARSPAANTP